MIAFRRHLDEASLAEVADLGRPDHLKAAERLHLDSCDRCRRLVTGHERASRLLSASWRLVPAAERAGSGVMVVRPRVGVGSALRAGDVRSRMSWLRLAVVLGAALLLVVTALLIASSRQPLPTSTRITFEDLDENRRLISVNTDGSGIASIVPGDGWERIAGPAWSPDGSRLAFVRYDETQSQLVIVAAGSPDEPRILDQIRPALSDHPFVWSPDGTLLAGWDERGLAVVDSESGERRLTVPWSFDDERGPVSWSPDGSRILYTRPPSYVSGRLAGDLVVLHVATAREALRYHADHLNSVHVSPNAWSPDGSQFVFYAQRYRAVDQTFVDPRVIVMGREGTDLRELAAGKDPTWSPDGAYIAFEAPYEGANNEETTIWVIRPDGSGLQFVGDGGVRPRWSPDGRQIAYCAHEHGHDVTEGRMGYFVADVAGGVPKLVYQHGCWYGGVPVWQPTPAGG